MHNSIIALVNKLVNIKSLILFYPGARFGQILYLHFQKLNFNHSKYPILLITMFGMYLQIFSE